MMKSKYKKSSGTDLAFIDTLFNINMIFVLLLFAVIMLINPKIKEQTGNVIIPAEMMLVMTWEDGSPHDVDLWVKSPTTVVGYPIRENDFLHLETDNLGARHNSVLAGKKTVDLKIRREVIMFRGKADGRYVVNTQLYAIQDALGKSLNMTSRDGVNIPVKIELIQINPTYDILATHTVILTKAHQEMNLISFVIDNGKVMQVLKGTNEVFVLKRADEIYNGAESPAQSIVGVIKGK